MSSDKINISTFGGEGELSNLQLDEKVLTELLELPAWLKLTSAWCNHVSFRISWTKLKSTPITLSLDEVNITVETCEFERTGTQTPTTVQSLAARQGKYRYTRNVHFNNEKYDTSGHNLQLHTQSNRWHNCSSQHGQCQLYQSSFYSFGASELNVSFPFHFDSTNHNHRSDVTHSC